MEDRLTPAIKLLDGKALSPEEFQRLLYEYFEERGILADLRSHLRMQMINVLRDTPLGKMMINRNKEISPKLQALNLLIAEYLLQKEYHYSLSVFSTEVPLSSVFPNFTNDYTSKEQMLKFRFSENDMWDILETLGFFKTCDVGQAVASSYCSCQKESLLNCIVRTGNFHKETSIDAIAKLKENCDMNLENFVALLKQHSISPQITLKLVEHLKSVILNEIKQIKDGKETEVLQIKKKYQDDTNKKLEKYKLKVAYMEHNFEREKKRLESELESAKGNLKQCAQSLQIKYKDIRKRDEDLIEKESKLKEHEEYLDEREKFLQEKEESMKVEFLKLKELQQQMEKKPRVDETTMKIEMIEKGLQTMDTSNIEVVLLKKNNEQLQYHINSLTEQNSMYLTRIQELAVRTSTLMRELEDSQQQVQQLNVLHGGAHIGGHSRPGTAPSVPTITYRNRQGISSYNGAGEEGRSVPPVTGRQFRNMSCKETKRRMQTTRKPSTQSTSSSEGVSPTDVILSEAKQRLMSLEKESEQIDKHFEILKTKTVSGMCSHSKLEMTPSNMLQNFQINVASIRDNISKILSKETYLNDSCSNNKPSTSSQVFHYIPDTGNVIFKRSEPALESTSTIKIKNLIAEIPTNLRGAEFEDVLQTLTVQNEEDGASCQSANSSALVLATSFSTVEVSSDLKTDTDADLTNGGLPSHENSLVGVWDNVGLSCVIVFALEMLLFR